MFFWRGSCNGQVCARKILSDIYENAAAGESVAMIHLFGIKYAKDIINAETANSSEMIFIKDWEAVFAESGS